MAQFEAKTLKGFRDFLPDAMAPRQAMLRVIEATFERQGFVPLSTPALEYAETLTGKYGDEGDKLLYKFQDHGEREVALRYDLTVPLARVVAQHRNDLQLPLRRYQVASVWRADKPQRGRFREFMQCDADIVGPYTALADAEVLCTGLAVLRSLGIEGAMLHLNHRDLLFSFLQAAGVDDPDQQLKCIRAVDKLDKIGQAGVTAEIVRECGLTDEQAAKAIAPFLAAEATGGAESEFARIRAFFQQELTAAALESALSAVARLETVLGLVTAAGFGAMIQFDRSVARGLDYYTGVIYETRLTDPRVAGIGAVMSGGRYDHLIGMFSRDEIPAVGISLGLDRLLAALVELGLIPGGQGTTPVCVTVFSADQAGTSLQVAQLLRDAGLRVEVDTQGGKLGKQLERAAKRGNVLAVVLGPDEVAAGEAVLKDLRKGEQLKVKIAELAQAAAHALAD